MPLRVRLPIPPSQLDGRKWKLQGNNGSIRKSRPPTNRLIVAFTSEKVYQETSKHEVDTSDDDDDDDTTSSDDDTLPERSLVQVSRHITSRKSIPSRHRSLHGEEKIIAALRRRCPVHDVEVGPPVVTSSDLQMHPNTVKCLICGRLQSAALDPTTLECGCRVCISCFKK